MSDLPPLGAALATAPVVLSLTKANAASTVHRAERLNYIGIKRFDGAGNVVGERRFLGLFTSSVYTSPVTELPVVRRKVAAVVARCGDQASTHDKARLMSILETYPRDELFDAVVDDLALIVKGILHLRERRRVKLFVRRDTYGRYASCLVFVPRDRYNTEVRHRIQDLLLEEFDATECVFDSQVSGAVLARVHVIVYTDPHAVRDVDVDSLEREIADVTRGWQDHLLGALVERHGEGDALDHYEQYGDAFPAAYRDDNRAAVAVDDIGRLEGLAGDELAVNLYRPLEADERSLHLWSYLDGLGAAVEHTATTGDLLAVVVGP